MSMLFVLRTFVNCGVLCLWLVSLPVFSQGLGTLIELAKQNDPQWILGNAKFRESKELLPQAYSQLLPSIYFTNNSNKVQQQLTNATTQGPEQNYPSSSRGITLRQPIFKTKQILGVNLASAQTEQALFNFKEESQQVTLRVVDAYINLMLATDRKFFLNSQVELINLRLKAAIAGLRAGQGVRIDVDEAQAELSKLKADEIQINQSITIAKLQLEMLTGISNLDISVLNKDKILIFTQSIPTSDLLFDQAKVNNPKFLGQKLDIEIAEFLLKQAASGHHPSLELIAQATLTTGESSYFVSTRNNNRLIGIQLNVPLYSGGVVNSQIRQAIAKLEQAQAQLSISHNNLKMQIHKESNALREGNKRIEAFKEAINSARQVVISSQKGILAGTRTELDVIKNQYQLAQVEFDLSRSYYDLFGAYIRLHWNLGLLNEETVALLN